MHSHGSTLGANFTKVSNFLLERKDVEFGAKGMLALMLVRKGWHEYNIKSLSADYGVSQAKISKWMRQLAELGYLIRRKVRDAKGRWKTMVHAYAEPQDFPGEDMSTVSADVFAGRSSTSFPSLGEPSLPNPSVPPTGVKTGAKTPPTPAPERASQTVVEMEGEEEKVILNEIGLRQPLLALSPRRRRSLVPLVTELLAKGAKHRDIVDACVRDSNDAEKPVGFLRHRLTKFVPQKGPQAPTLPTVREVLTSPEPTEGLCPECGRPMIRVCAHCAGIEPKQPGFLIEATARGASRARELLAAKTQRAA